MALSVGEVAKRADVKVSTLHFYEEKGLIQGWRNAGNQRRYDRNVLRRIAVIKTAQMLGMSLAEIKEAMDHLPSDHAPSKAEWKEMANAWQEALDTKIAKLQSLRNELDACIGCGCLSMTQCKLRNPDDKLGKEASGPVLWEQESVNQSKSE